MMPRCVAAGCSNNHFDPVSFHRFPKEELLFNLWVAAVSRTRKFFTGSRHSYVCSAHFTEADYEPRSLLAPGLGLSGRNPKRLKKGAVPSVFTKPVRPGSVGIEKKKRHSSAYEKRERARIISDISETSSSLESSLESADMEPKIHNVETQTDQCVHCDCCMLKQTKIKMKDFSIQFHTPTIDQAMQIFGDEENAKGCMPINESKEEDNTEVEMKDASAAESKSECENESEDGTWDESEEDDSDEEEYEDDDIHADPDYNPIEDVEDFDDLVSSEYVHGDLHKGRKFLVFEDQLLTAFQQCVLCSAETDSEVCAVIGTFCRIRQYCPSCNFTRVWDSQPYINNTPAGNLLLSAATLFSGSSISKVYKLFQHLHCAIITPQTFHSHQRRYLLQSIEVLWAEERLRRIELLKTEGEIVLGGDGRCDSPGHCAKYGCYTLMDLKTGKIVNVELVQSNEVTSSSAMEKEGLVRSVCNLKEAGVEKIDVLVTDRHSSIQKWVRENMQDTTHKYDIWHIAKGLKKKVAEVTKKASGKQVRLWARSIVNHLYWSGTSTQSGDGDVMVAKWKSLLNHMQNVHEGHDELFPKCLHQEIEGTAKTKKWLIPGSLATNNISAVISHPKLLKDISKMSEKHQTSKLEVFHSVLNHFAPKMYHYSFRVQKCRTLLAAIHYNENGGRRQAETMDGVKQYSIVFPKFKKGEPTVKEVAVDATYDYVDKLMNLIVAYCRDDNVQPALPVPPALCSNYVHPDKAEAVAMHRTRFKKT